MYLSPDPHFINDRNYAQCRLLFKSARNSGQFDITGILGLSITL